MRALIERIGTARPGLTRIAAAAGCAAVLGLAACAGDNLFENGGTTSIGSPPIIALVTAPATAREGQTIDVRVKAIGRRGITKIDIHYRGAANVDQSFPVSPSSADTVTIDASLVLPDTAKDTSLRIEVTATDQFGGVSEIARRTVTITDASAPQITATVGSTTASAGGSIALRVNAKDDLGLKQVGYAIITAAGDTLGGKPTLFNASGITRDTLFNIPLPTTIQPSTVRVIGIAVNASNLRGVSLPLAVTVVDSLKPTVDITEPQTGDSYPLRDSIGVRVHVKDASGIKSLTIRGVSFRNFPDSTQNATPIIRFPAVIVPLPQGPDRPLPIDTVIFRFLKPTSDTTSEPIYIIAEATDAQNNIGVDTVRIIAGPRVVILNPASGAVARTNSDLLVRLQANDPQAGIDSLKLYITGVQQDSFVFKGLGSTREQVDRSVALHIGNATGTITLKAFVFNSLGVRGSTSNSPIINITTSQATDSIPPRVSRVLLSSDRIELTDTIRVRVTATDDAGSGVARMGAVVITIPNNESPALPRDTFYLLSRLYSPPLGGTPDTTFAFRLSEVYKEIGAARFPLPFTIQVHAFAIDAQGRCGASVQETFQSLPCDPIPGQGGFFTSQGQTGRIYNPTAVIGTSVTLPPGSIIADALPDTTNRRVYLSNLGLNKVEVIDVVSKSRIAPILVGSEPWGLFLVPGGAAPDTLMVANSGGTNISFVPTNTMVEAPARRLLTPNDVLLGISESFNNGFLRYSPGATLDFSDRPQFIAEDKNRVILYSTKPTGAAPEGTIRAALSDPTPAIANDTVRPEASIIITAGSIISATDQWAIAHVDSVVVVSNTTSDDQVIIYDHVPGFPNSIIKVGPAYLSTAIFDSLSTKLGSDAFGTRGLWNRAAIALHDTTYVAASGDLSTIAFGEGASAGTGRIFLWTAAAGPVPAGLNAKGTADLIGNASERVFGVSLSQNGKLGAARGGNSTYFFSNNVQQEGFLRLQGVFAGGVAGGNGGVALHPHHAAVIPQTPTQVEDAISFIATSNRTIKIVDTFHFFEIGEVSIRDNIVGQLRAAPAAPGVNTPFGGDRNRCDFVIVQLYGVTSTNNLVIVDIRKRDILKGGGTCTQ